MWPVRHHSLGCGRQPSAVHERASANAPCCAPRGVSCCTHCTCCRAEALQTLGLASNPVGRIGLGWLLWLTVARPAIQSLTVTGYVATPATSAPGLGSPLPHRHRD